LYSDRDRTGNAGSTSVPTSPSSSFQSEASCLVKVLASIYIQRDIDANDVEIIFCIVHMEEVKPSETARYRKTYVPYPQYRVKYTRENGYELFFVPAREILCGACLVPVLDRKEENFNFEDNATYCTDERRGLWYNVPPERMYVGPSKCYRSLIECEYDDGKARKSPLTAGKVFHSMEYLAEQQRAIEIAVHIDQEALIRERKEKAVGFGRRWGTLQNLVANSDEECSINDYGSSPDDGSCAVSEIDYSCRSGEESS